MIAAVQFGMQAARNEDHGPGGQEGLSLTAPADVLRCAVNDGLMAVVGKCSLCGACAPNADRPTLTLL